MRMLMAAADQINMVFWNLGESGPVVLLTKDAPPTPGVWLREALLQSAHTLANARAQNPAGWAASRLGACSCWPTGSNRG
jgi:hypothetical protein